MADKKGKVSIWLAAFFICALLCPGIVYAAGAGEAVTGAAAGMIEVQSGFLDAAGRFRKMKSAAGFLIANEESSTYIITNCETVSNTPRSIRKYCKENSINTENTQFSNYIQVVVKGDVTAQAQVVVKSAEKDYCVLSTANVVSQKESLKLGDSSGVEVNDIVYAYGFPREQGADAQDMSVMDAQASQGAVTEKEAVTDDGICIAHSAPVGAGYAGGPLLDADGYVIGLGRRQSPEEDTGIAYALPVNEISAVLDNFTIYYGSRAIDEASGRLEAAYGECTGILDGGGYKKSTMEALSLALEKAKEALSEEKPAAAVLDEAYSTLAAARDGLVPKTKALTIIIRVLPVWIGILFIWTLVLAVKNSKEKKQMHAPAAPSQQDIYPARSGTGVSGAYANGSVRYAGAADLSGAAGGNQPGVQGRGAVPGGQQAGYGGQLPAASGSPDMRRAASSGMPDVVRQRQQAVPPAGRRLRVLRQKTGQTVMVNKTQFVLGKSQNQADFCITDNQTVSRRHAVLFENHGSWYVDDLNSLNGTFLNGRKITAGQAAAVRDGDEIRLSDESFLIQG